jgi:hypothetical protein
MLGFNTGSSFKLNNIKSESPLLAKAYFAVQYFGHNGNR